MTKTISKHIPASKVNAVKEMINLIKTKKTILVADISSIPGSQFQKIGKKLRGKAVLKVPKKNLFFRAIDESKKEGLEKLKEFFEKPVAILFSDLDSYDLAGELVRNKSPTKAKPGQIAPIDLEIPAGPTDLVPGPAISELGALGIQIQIQGGKIEIKAPKVIAKKDQKISDAAAAMLSKLGIMPFKIGFAPVSAYDSENKTIYANIKIDAEGATLELKELYGKALAFAVSIGCFNTETISHLIRKAGSHERRLIKVLTGEPDEPIHEEIKAEVPLEKKEEKNVNAAEGLASLFG
ncbi:MAG: 50S ribosomal protein L10 [Nanoarchaeota archaeon]|nr:50S ribosomal protein L10 [Nanoarchaeota archaeon]